MSTRDWQQQRAAEKRDALLQAALQVFSREGYEAGSLARIAAEAGVSSATLYKHFPTKASLFEASLAELLQGASPLGELPAAPHDVARHLARRHAQQLLDPRIHALMRLLIAEAPRQPELVATFYERLKGPWFAPWVAWAQTLPAASEVEPTLMVRQLAGLVEGHLLVRGLLAPHTPIDTAHVEDIVDLAVDTWSRRWLEADARRE